MELSPTSAALAQQRNVGEVVTCSVLEMPFVDDAFDLAVSLDVIEHLDDDLAALQELRRVVAPGGALLVTVPAYGWLWSGHDELNHHRRRYTRRSLRQVAERAGWRQVRATYFNSLLLPVAIALRVLDRFNRKTTESSLDLWVPPEPFNWLLERPLAIEASVIGRGGRIPAGLVPAGRVPLNAGDGLALGVRVTGGPTGDGHGGVYAERPGAVGEEGRDGHDHGGRHLGQHLVQVGVV